MSFQFMPLYTGDYLRDTQHLSCSEHGIYIKLLMHCWDQKTGLPLDERKLLGVVNARSGDEIEAMRRVLSEFFIQCDDGWYNKRISEEIAKAEGLSAARSDAGKLGAANRLKSKAMSQSLAIAKQVPSNCSAIAKQVPSNCSASDEKNAENAEKTIRRQGRATRLPEDWVLPDEWREWALRTSPNITAEQLSSIADNFKDYWVSVPGAKGLKLNWFATWRNRIRDVAPGGGITTRRGASVPSDSWWMSNGGIDRKGRELGMTARGGESYESFKSRIFDALKATT